MALSGKVSTGRLNKFCDILASAKMFIDTKERMPSKIADDVEERRLGIWIVNNKFSEKGTNSEREQLMRREILLAFMDNSRPDQDVKWRDILASAKTFIDTKERMPKKIADDVEERRLGNWIANNKFSEKGTNSEREQLMRREIPLAFVEYSRPDQDVKWIDNLASAKTFIDTKERMPNQRAGDVDERRLGIWIANNNASERRTNSAREQLMRREIPLAFANL